jgi:hypothetical protein
VAKSISFREGLSANEKLTMYSDEFRFARYSPSNL